MDAKPEVLLLRAAGTNCELESKYAFETCGAAGKILHVKKLLSEPGLLHGYQILMIPGGFSYGDDIASGKIFANEILYFLKEELKRFVSDGKLVLGICNGFQVLVKARVLPGDNGDEQTVTLSWNDSNRYECRWVRIRACSPKSIFFKDGSVLAVPVAHAEGKFMPKDAEVLRSLDQNGQIAFKYVDRNGNAGDYPVNPNGSVADVAGIIDSTGRVLGMMPHPERHVRNTQYPEWTRISGRDTPDGGLEIFKRAVNYAKESL